MRNRNQIVELSHRRLNSRPPRPPTVRNLEQAQQYYTLTYPEEEPQPEPQSPQEPQQQLEDYYTGPQNTLWNKFRRDKAVNIAIILMLCLYIYELWPICGGLYHLFQRSYYKRALRNQLSKPLQLMSADLKADPIMEIQILDRGSTCPSGFEIHKLGLWPGTFAGCLCEDGKIRGAPCYKVKDEKCKKDLPSTIPIEMYEWEKSIWCVKRAVIDVDYVKKAECPSGYKECFIGGCFKGDCPITSLEITSPGGMTNKFASNDKSLQLTRKQGELPLINVQMTFGDIPCFTQDLFEQTLKNFTYHLTAIKGNCDKYGLDGNFSTKLDSQRASDSFAQNSFPYPVMNLPYFKENANDTTSMLSSMVRMKTAKHDYCLDIDENSINDYINVSEATWSFVCCIFLLIIRAITIIISCCCFASCSNRELFDDAKEMIFKLLLVNLAMSAGTVFMLVAFREVYQTFGVLKGYFEGYNSLECFAGGQGSMVINDSLELLKNIEGGFWFYWGLLGVSLACFFIHISLYIVEKIESRRRNKRNL